MIQSTGLSDHEKRGALTVLGARWGGRDTFTVDEAAEILGLSRCSAYAATKTGQIPTIRIGRRLLVPRIAIERKLTGEAA